jgi:ComF family protein
VLRAATRLLLQTLAPRRCAACDALSDTALCSGCEATIAASPQPALRRLGVGRAAAAFVFDGAVRDAVHRGKYAGDRGALRALARLAAPRLLAQLPPPDALVAVALAPRRQRSRGFNQALDIAAVLGEAAQRPVLAGLERVRETAVQAEHRGEAARRANVAGAFAWRGVGLAGRPLWLVDDVLTTGATVAEAAAAMVRAGAARVDVAVLAAVP